MTVSAIAPMTGWYDYGEVARSVLIAIAASYAALDLTGRVTAASGRLRLARLSGGGVAMGIGILDDAPQGHAGLPSARTRQVEPLTSRGRRNARCLFSMYHRRVELVPVDRYDNRDEW